jgi:hypothetical protein
MTSEEFKEFSKSILHRIPDFKNMKWTHLQLCRYLAITDNGYPRLFEYIHKQSCNQQSKIDQVTRACESLKTAHLSKVAAFREFFTDYPAYSAAFREFFADHPAYSEAFRGFFTDHPAYSANSAAFMDFFTDYSDEREAIQLMDKIPDEYDIYL